MFFTFISIIAIWPDSGKDHDAGLTSAELKLEEKTEKDSISDSNRRSGGQAPLTKREQKFERCRIW